MLSIDTVRKINLISLFLLLTPLVGAFGIQIIDSEIPCPLCLLQRVGMFGVAVGILMNLKFGIHPLHYGISIVSALIGAAVSTRQVLLHVAPKVDGSTGFGDPVLGLHLYTWALVVFLVSIFAIALLMIFMKWAKNLAEEKQVLNKIEKAVFFIFIIVALANTIGAFLECGFSPCPDNPTHYKYLIN
ncbi:MAG: disulfide bond formation protein B [Helicobacteraceae bacterium]|nr:disulfide bond formation protein B [Helicobacteraceae bacterium]